MMTWAYPELLRFVNSRTIETVTPIYILNGGKVTGESSAEAIQDNDLFIGYTIVSTTGLLTDSSLCLINFNPSWVNAPTLGNLIKQHNGRTCIIDITSESWGPKKISSAKEIFTEWIKDYNTHHTMNPRIIIDVHTQKCLTIKVKLLMNIRRKI